MLKRKRTSDDSGQRKRPKIQTNVNQGSNHHPPQTAPATRIVSARLQDQGQSTSAQQRKGKEKATTTAAKASKVVTKTTPHSSGSRDKIRKLAPPRPFPTVPSSVSSDGPRSAHKEGKNLICITRHTSLAAYLSRCRKVLVDEGYQVLHLHAMGAAIPHLLTLAVSLPTILPFARHEVKVEVRTGTVDVMDEIIPENEDEDMSLRTRSKAGASVVIQIRNGNESVVQNHRLAEGALGKGQKKPEVLVFQEQEDEDEDEDEDEMVEDEMVEDGDVVGADA